VIQKREVNKGAAAVILVFVALGLIESYPMAAIAVSAIALLITLL